MLGSAGAETLSIVIVAVYSSECKLLDVSLMPIHQGGIGTYLTPTEGNLSNYSSPLVSGNHTCCGLKQGELELPSWQTREGNSEGHTPVETAPRLPASHHFSSQTQRPPLGNQERA